MKKTITVAALLVFLLTFVAFVVLAILPGYLDEFLLTNNNYCYLSAENGHANNGGGRPSIKIDFGGYERKMVPDTNAAQPSLQRQQQKQGINWQNGDSMLQRVANSILWRLLLHLPEHSKEENNNHIGTDCPLQDETQQSMKSYDQDELQQFNFNGDKVSKRLHPLCEGYRTFRTRMRFQQLLLPWNWHYRNELHFKGLTIHSLADEVSFVRADNAHSPGWMHVRSLFSRSESPWVNAVPSSKSNPTEQSPTSAFSMSRLPPSMEIETVSIAFQSWTRPVVSTELRGVTINIVVQKGELPFPMHLRTHDIARVANSSAFLIGAMSIQEALLLAPKPPEQRGLYPRIGIMNISNATVNVYQNKASNNSSSITLMMKVRIPDKFFHPITNLTYAYKETGIDRKDFQPMMESSISIAVRQHLLRETTSALRNSWTQAHKAQEQIQHFAEKAQEVYLDRWIGMTVQAWHQTQENVWKGVVNGTAPLVQAVENWVTDMKQIVTEPLVPPLTLVISHHWNRTLEGINKHGKLSNGKKITWGHFDDFIKRSNQFKHDKRISKQLGELSNAFQRFIAKSGQDLELLAESCELEVKEIWLAWHRQFMPEF